MDKQLENKMQQPAQRPHEDARRPMRSPNFGANYGPSASYTPATDNPTCHKAPSVEPEGE